jgi:hypothetical protein
VRILAFAAAVVSLVTGAELSGRVTLNEKLSAWKQEIEAGGEGRVIVARIYVQNGAYLLPADVEERATLARFFSQYEFRAQFVHTHALNLNVDGPQRMSFVLLNMDRMKESSASEEELISHELGHVWLHWRGLRAPPLVPGALACEAIHTGDIVQHILIRREQTRRGLEWKKGWLGDLEKAYQSLVKQPEEKAPPADLCLRLQRLSLVIDLRMGLAESDWEHREQYAGRLTSSDPLLGELITRLIRLLNALDLENRIEYYAGLGAVRSASTLLIQQLVEKATPPVLR